MDGGALELPVCIAVNMELFNFVHKFLSTSQGLKSIQLAMGLAIHTQAKCLLNEGVHISKVQNSKVLLYFSIHKH